MKDLVGVARRYKKTVAGGAWELVSVKLFEIYGQRKSYVRRIFGGSAEAIGAGPRFVGPLGRAELLHQ